MEAATYRRQMHRVTGWFSELDGELFEAMSAAQQAARVGGDLLEIGAFLGKSAILLGYLVSEGETLHVCDLFESSAREEANRYPGLRRASFERNYLRFHPSLPVIHQRPSQELLGVLRPDSFRFVHVDGSHLYEIVRQDISTARALLREGGVVVFDDYRTLYSPGVAAAVWQACADGLVPLVLSNGKLYGTFDRGPRADHVMREFQASGIPFDVVPFTDRDLLKARETLSVRQRVVRAITPPAVRTISRRLRKWQSALASD